MAMNLFRSVLLLLVIVQQSYSQELHFKTVEIDSNVSFRGLSVADDSVAWISGARKIKGVYHGAVGKTVNGGKEWKFSLVKGGEKLDYRSIFAFNANEAVIANAGAPASILRTKDGGETWDVVYRSKDSLAFFDGVDFWNDREGIIYGDSLKDGHMLLLITNDGGRSWQELPVESRPKLFQGEASFAASGTGIRCYGKEKVMVATGGKVSRLFVSMDKGKNWKIILPPVIQGETTSGIFSFAFKNDSVGILVGGDFNKEASVDKNVFYTRDGGKTWKSPKMTIEGGWRECVEFTGANTAIAVGPSGLNVTLDEGNTWILVDIKKGFHVIRKARNGNLVIGAGFDKVYIIENH